MPRAKERSAVFQLRRSVSSGPGLMSAAAQQVDIAFAGKVEAVAIRADERAGRGG
jgi:hypothetical protein